MSTLTIYTAYRYWGYQIEEDEMGGACGMHEKDENFLRAFRRKHLKKSNHIGDIDVDGRIILKWVLE
jgi:hypothetical protein